MAIYLANDKYAAVLTSGYTAGQNTLYVSAVPDNVPTIIVAAKGTDNETVFAVTGSTVNSLTGVTRLKGANVDLDSQTPLTCLNNEEFVNQFAGAVSTPETLKNIIYAEDGGSSDDYAISLDPAPSEYVAGMLVAFKANTANTGAATLNINSLGAKAIKTRGRALETGEIEAGQIVTVVYDGTDFQLVSRAPLTTGGWIPTGETWTFSSVNDPTGVITVPSDATTKYSVGMRIKLTNGGNTIYGIITALTSTSITFLHEIDPTDSLALHLMDNSTITNPYYSTQKAPFGFPLDPTKWAVTLNVVNNLTQNSPTKNIWYNIGSLSINFPIGLWRVWYNAQISFHATTVKLGSVMLTLSKTNNSESDPYFTTNIAFAHQTSGQTNLYASVAREKVLSLATATRYYINMMTADLSMDSLRLWGTPPATFQAVCAYL